MEGEKKEPSEDISREIQKSAPEPIITSEIADREEGIAKAVTEIPYTHDRSDERTKKVVNFLKTKEIWVIGVLIIALILGVYIRSLPMQERGGHPGLWDITTNTWTLGPDLDPWLFERYARTIVEEGSLPSLDMMRNVPLGFDTTTESQLLPHMIVWTYNVINIFQDASVTYAAIVFPVIMFALTIISFFFFVREIFIKKSKSSRTRANLIALISTFFMAVIPTFLSRTVAGIPEKESAAFFFLFAALYFFLKSWKDEKLSKTIVFSVVAGILTAALGMIWGGVLFVFISVAIASLIAFILDKVDTKEFLAYSIWVFISFSILIIFTGKFSLIGLLTSISTGLPFIVFFIFVVHFTLQNTKLSKLRILKRTNLPDTIVSLIVAILLIIVLAAIIFGPSFIVAKVKAIHQTIFQPVVGRWNTTVAENRQPFFTEWGSNFGPFFKKIPLLFWSFIIGSVVLFRNMLNKIKDKDAWVLTGFYVLFLLGLIFSRYSASSIFNGDNFISKTFYYVSAFLLFGALLYYYNRYNREGNLAFKKISYGYLLLFSLFGLALFSARGAVRLIMVLGPIAPIFVGYLIVKSISVFLAAKDETKKIVLGVFIILLLLASVFSFWTFYKTVKVQSYNFVPSYYNQQWQKAMEWVRDTTPEDSVFSHWWDYGYWVQSIGNRATVLDGGNAIGYWNYLMGRHVLTGDNQKDALEFLYNHDATHLLIDSSDIGKYGAYSSIGSDIDFDRFSWIGTFLLDDRQTRETKEQTLRIYAGGVALDEDLIIQNGEKEILLPGQQAGIGAIVLPSETSDNDTKFSQPYVIVVYQGQQHNVNLRYLSLNGEFLDFGSGIEATAFIFTSMTQDGGSINANPIGAAMYISPRLMRGLMAQVYILGDPLNNFPNFKLVHAEQSIIVDNLNQQGMNLPDFVYFQGIQGPIKIWEITYTGEEEIKEEYIDTDPNKYLNWTL